MNRACEAIGLSRATAYRHLRPKPLAERARPRSHRRIPDSERQAILKVLDSERFMDQPPREVYGALLSEGKYLCSVRTMYRVLEERSPIRERRNHREPRHFAVPRLEATAPNQVWSWDISKLATYETGVFLSLYVVLDLYSRFVPAWMVAQHENSALAKQLFAEAVTRHDVNPESLVVHMDRGAPMTSRGFAELLGQLGIDRSYSRPRVSNDNAFSESHFHTLKYQPDYPGHFSGPTEARAWCEEFFEWYNYGHHHDGLALFTPADVFFGRVEEVASIRQKALTAAYQRHPERFINGAPCVPRPPKRVLLNPLDAAPSGDVILRTPHDEIDNLWPPGQSPKASVIHVPGARNEVSQLAT
ncbi:MAG: IS3 family transposase [Myxococcota bacterium]